MMTSLSSMSVSGLGFLFTTIVYLHIPVLHAQTISQGPVNTAQIHQQPSTVQCHIDNFGDSLMEWNFFPNGSTDRINIFYYDARDGDTFIHDDYVADESGFSQGRFDISVLETTVESAGRYQCRILKTAEKEEANFVSLEPIRCDPPPGEEQIIEGASVNLVCDVGYTGYKAPSFKWFSFSGSELLGTWTYNYEKSSYVANVTVTPEYDMMEFTCELDFTRDASDTTDPPSYNDTCTTHFLVLHPPYDLTISSDSGCLQPEGRITCNAKGNPTLTYHWVDANTSTIISNTSLLVVTEAMLGYQWYMCTAENTYGKINGTLTFQVCNPPYDLTISSDSGCLQPEDRITCNAKGNPTLTYHWVDANTSTIISNTSLLVVTEAMLGYQWYTCTAENTYGKINGTLTFQVCNDMPEPIQIIQPPLNTANIAGSDVEFQCHIQQNPVLTDYISWEECITPEDGGCKRISNDDVIVYSAIGGDPDREARYSISNPQIGQYNLNVTGVVFQEDAGKYRCMARNDATVLKDAELVTIDNSTRCYRNTTTPNEAVVGDVVTMSCEVWYHGRWAPTITWSEYGGNNSYPTQANYSLISQTITIEVTQDHDGRVYSTSTMFENITGVGQDEASNTPDYVYNFTYQPLTVWNEQPITCPPCVCAKDFGLPTPSQVDSNGTRLLYLSICILAAGLLASLGGNIVQCLVVQRLNKRHITNEDTVTDLPFQDRLSNEEIRKY